MVAGYALAAHHLRLLQAACESWDRMQAARAIVDAEGVTVKDRYGVPKAHPAVAIERDCRTSFARLVRELDLDAEALADPRPPRYRGRR